MKLVNLESVGNVIDESGVTYPMLADGGYDIFGGIHIHDIENEEWFESLSEEDSDSLLTEKEKSDFNDAMNGDYTGFDSFLENNLIA